MGPTRKLEKQLLTTVYVLEVANMCGDNIYWRNHDASSRYYQLQS